MICKKIRVHYLHGFLGIDASFRPDMSINYNISGVLRFRSLKTLFSRKPPFKRLVGLLGKMILTEDVWAGWREKFKTKLLDRSPMILTETRQVQALEDLYREDIARLQTLISRDITHWLKNTVTYGKDA